jgi:hypothetical protein
MNYTAEQIVKIAEWAGHEFYMYDNVDLPETDIWVKKNGDIFRFNLSNFNIIKQLESKMMIELDYRVKIYEHNELGYFATYCKEVEHFYISALRHSGYCKADEKSAILDAVWKHIEGRR